jgi:ribonucleoside-diphosphate reductase beta chain
MSVFEERINHKPFEYPECVQFKKAIQGSYWVVDEFNFSKDISDYNSKLSEAERDCIRKCMLAISQVEVTVKKFWGSLHDRLPKPEINQVGSTFSESEVRHEDAYSELLSVLGLNDQFEKIFDIPCIIGRVNYLRKYQNYLKDEDPRKFLKSVILFSLFVENVSLFSQFFITQKSF